MHSINDKPITIELKTNITGFFIPSRSFHSHTLTLTQFPSSPALRSASAGRFLLFRYVDTLSFSHHNRQGLFVKYLLGTLRRRKRSKRRKTRYPTWPQKTLHVFTYTEVLTCANQMLSSFETTQKKNIYWPLPHLVLHIARGPSPNATAMSLPLPRSWTRSSCTVCRMWCPTVQQPRRKRLG